MAQEEIMHVPMVVNHHRHHHVEQESLSLSLLFSLLLLSFPLLFLLSVIG